MEKIAKDFWGNEILLCGCEQTDVNFCKTLHKTFTENGVEIRAGCPLMLYRGFPCAMHASFAGVGKERNA